MNSERDAPGTAPVAKHHAMEEGDGLAKSRYEQLRARLTQLWAAPVPDMAAIEATMVEVGEAQAAFEAALGGTGKHTGIKLHSPGEGDAH